MAEGAELVVEVAAGTPERQLVVEVPWQDGLTVYEAVERSGVLAEFPQLDRATLMLGRFGQSIREDAPLSPGDRIDVCRPLPRDPREMRRDMLSAGTVMGRPKPPGR